jgi:Zn-dependent protease with chaperone function
LVSIAARVLLPNRFYSMPQVGLMIWFSTLSSSIVASGTALFGLLSAYLISAQQLSATQIGGSNWLAGFALSFIPWIALASFGVLLALVNLRLDSPFISGRKLQQALTLAKKPLMQFQGIPVSVISAPIHYAMATGREIVVSSYLVEELTEDEMEAVLWHELGHIRGHHRLLKSIARAVAVLTRPISISRVFQESVDQLCELVADNFAKRHCHPEAVDRVRFVLREQS